ncbi:hypothetical protein [Hymenobacter wooponensis]|uniref:Uncharacterized protein n=1 Tax=Hymenobacter wooponensis TaxID=1525360 RepID=A0A4Z0MRS9_9BACT|nr:hypothetical protein [Hymenobacter wooponensis]TGD82542.1 hypothetical protein EU557_01785 [Hymenobacter wooponensis]
MSKLPYTLTAKDFPGIPTGWTLTYDEPSNNFYHVRLTSEYGPEVEMNGGADLEELVSCCIEDAKEFDKQLQVKKSLK